MSTCSIVIGETGGGKSTSLRNVKDGLLIQSIKKPLPFRGGDWKLFDGKTEGGNVFVTDDYEKIIKIMQKTEKKKIFIDDFQYIIANEFMRRNQETGYGKFTEMANHTFQIIRAAMDLPDDVTVYIFSHSETNEFGKTKFKTIGKLLDEKIVIEGLVSIVFRAYKDQMDGKHYFATKNNGTDTTKTPMGMFEGDRVENDIEEIDKIIREYYK